jgi:hypothetical protein
LPAVVVVVVVVIVVAIIVIADPPQGTIPIANAITIAAPGLRIVRSVMATPLLYLGGRAINTKVDY